MRSFRRARPSDPATVLPRAIFITIGITTLLYFLVQLAFVSALPGGATRRQGAADRPRRWLAGPVRRDRSLTLAAIASLAGNLHGIMTSTPRVTYALAERGDLPGWFGRGPSALRDAGQFDPVLRASSSAALAISGSYVWLAVISTLARMIVYAVTIAALPRAPGQAPAGRLALAASARPASLICAWARVAGRPRRRGRRWPRSPWPGLLLYALREDGARTRSAVEAAGSSSASAARSRRSSRRRAAAIAVVEDRRLARRDAIFRAVESAPSRRRSLRRHRPRQRAHLDADLASGPRRASSTPRPASPRPPARGAGRPPAAAAPGSMRTT